MSRAVTAVLLLALVPASAHAQQEMQMHVHMEDFMSSLDQLASRLTLDLGLPAGGLGAVWPDQVASLADLGSVVATLGEAGPLDALLGRASGLGPGDVLALAPTAETTRWQARAYTRGGARWTHADLTIHIQMEDFYSLCDAAGLDVPGRALTSVAGITVLAVVEDAAAFGRAFRGEAGAVRGQAVLLTASASGTTALAVHASDMPVWGLRVRDGRVELVR